jgi:hypothetical protein
MSASIKFDGEHISERSGRRVPLDIDTNEPHDCPVRRSQQEQRMEIQKRYHNCRKGCGQFIYFDVKQRTKRGKWIPIEKRPSSGIGMGKHLHSRCYIQYSMDDEKTF